VNVMIEEKRLVQCQTAVEQHERVCQAWWIHSLSLISRSLDLQLRKTMRAETRDKWDDDGEDHKCNVPQKVLKINVRASNNTTHVKRKEDQEIDC
jgi:hypothetical protein